MAEKQANGNLQTEDEGPDNAGVLAFPPVIFLVIFVVGLALHFAFSIRILPEGWV